LESVQGPSTDGLDVQGKSPVVILPGLGNADNDYTILANALEDRGAHVVLPRLQRWEWAKNARGVFRFREYFGGKLRPLPTLQWYVDKVTAAIGQCKEDTGADRVTLVAHSAAGWLSRVWMEAYGTESIEKVVCLGSPMLTPDVAAFDQTRGLLTYVERYCPGAYDVPFVCTIGKYAKGSSRLRDGVLLELALDTKHSVVRLRYGAMVLHRYAYRTLMAQSF